MLHRSLIFLLNQSGSRYGNPMGDITLGISKAYGKIPWVISLSEFPKLTGKCYGWHHSVITLGISNAYGKIPSMTALSEFPQRANWNISLVSTQSFPIACSCGSASNVLGTVVCAMYRSAIVISSYSGSLLPNGVRGVHPSLRAPPSSSARRDHQLSCRLERSSASGMQAAARGF